MNSRILYRIGLFGGLIPMIGGLAIFLSWWMGRALYAKDLTNLATAGYYWIMISALVAITGLITSLVVLVKGDKRFYRRSIVALVILVANIPVCGWVLMKQDDLAQRVYVQIHNLTGQDLELSFTADYFQKDIGKLRDGNKQVNFYYPLYIENESNDSQIEISPVFLVANGHKTVFPSLMKGACIHLDLDANFTLHHKSEE